MNPSKPALAARAIDFTYVSALIALTAAGLIVSTLPPPRFGLEQGVSLPVKLIYFALLEASMLVWTISTAAGRAAPRIAGLLALRLQAQAAMQVYVHFLTAGLFGLGVAYGLRWIESGDSLPHFLGLPAVADVGRFLIIAAPLLVCWTTTWRLNMLNRRGLAFADVASGKLNRVELVLAAPLDVAAPRLAYFVRALTAARAAELPFMQYGKKPSVALLSVHGSEGYELSWRYCPSTIRLLLAPHGQATTLVMTVQLRGGFHRHELFVNANDAAGLIAYMQTHVLQPLSSELALSASTARQDGLRAHALEMQLRILQAQIEPHFLFNTLASVRHLYRSSTDAGEHMMDHVITYLRCTMQELRSDVSTVGKEMDLLVHYLAIMKIRMGERLSYTFIHGDDVARRPFPPAMLISLVENAIKHGLADTPDGKLTISAARDEQHVRVTVHDNGPGFSSVQGTGVGLSNIRQRLEAIYGNRAWLEVGALAHGGFEASIVVPLQDGAHDAGDGQTEGANTVEFA